jgi:exportin-2 (importin alpha re-exporter)
VLKIVFARLQNSRTENFAIKFTRWYHVVSARQDKGLGADFFIAAADAIQNECVWQSEAPNNTKGSSSIFRQLYPQVILQETQKLARPIDRKVAVISFTKTIADSTNFVERYKKGWAHSANAMLAVLENPIVPQTVDPIITDLDVNDMSFGVGYTPLNTVRKIPQDPWPEIVDVKKWVGQYLTEANRRHNGRIGVYAQEMLKPEAQQALASYMQR